MTDLLRASDRARRTLARRLPILVGIVVVSACSYTPTSSGLPLTRPSASHAPSSLGTTAPQITPRPGETPRAETAGTGPTQETIDTSGVSPPLAETVDRTPEWAEVVAAWSSCMARSGYDVSSWDDAYEQIATALDTMISAAQPELVGSGDTVWVAPGRSGLPDPTEYQALQQRERDTASADLACRQEVDAEGERATILVSLEEDFLEENRGQLDAMLDWFTVFG